MSCSVVHILTIIAIFTIPNVVTSSLVQETCNKTINVELCLQLFEADPKIVSATNSFNLSIAIMEAGISYARNTHNYIKGKLNETNLAPEFMSALQACNSSYAPAIGSMRSALGEVQDIKVYSLATYDLAMAGTETMGPCLNALAAQETKDETILTGNKAWETFLSGAFNVVTILEKGGT